MYGTHRAIVSASSAAQPIRVKQDHLVQVLPKDLAAALGCEIDRQIAVLGTRGELIRLVKQCQVHHIGKFLLDGIQLLLLVAVKFLPPDR